MFDLLDFFLVAGGAATIGGGSMGAVFLPLPLLLFNFLNDDFVPQQQLEQDIFF